MQELPTTASEQRLQDNQLPQRWRGKSQFTIAAPRFGTGVDFLTTWQAWQADPQRCARLHFIAIEPHPLQPATLRELLANYPELQPFAAELIAHYPPLLDGFHRLTFAQGHLTLTLCFMALPTALSELVARVDVWYSPEHLIPALEPWYALPAPSPVTHANVIGGGIAGCQIAHALAKRGWEVTLYERHTRLAMEASGNRAGVLTPKMTAEAGWGETFYRQAFLFAVQQIRQLQAAGQAIDWAQCGALQLAHEPREAARQQALRVRELPADFIQILDQAEASAVAGIPLPSGASYFPQAGWLNPASLCAALVAHPNIEVRTLTDASVLPMDGVTIIASGREADRFAASQFLPFMPVLGQTSAATASAFSQQLKTTLGHEGYLTPALAGQHIFGATFVRNRREPRLDAAADTVNHQQLAQYLPAFAASLGTVQTSHAAIRMTTPDRYPVVGALPDVAFFQQAYAELRHGRANQPFPLAHYQPSVWIAAGFGSRGLTTSGLCAELLAALLTGEPLPMQATLYRHLHPARFLIRQLKRG
ncbi:FAD-dependent 5-carboxymethylaminomethyl-2-thiouridine(34) oxidoreductase MnmC [Thiothrix subterranea]|uniref:FAD-dependent 5-carboxymethylaminomethyl-2-thiouridine(34) oxidoreductase MnmC n=1 Tax=Thiothrix subterranea TaxID=2735563 RepID=UPI00192B61E7|nr:FAD-dependent 5-carboxymethylaminomethyl-2-thiouridine(34) oxidoreductase MnmC [Thiothrix subterranea]QQZ30086.1 FAD-dependent 5-carboxymethylaminomethyl-2-thiouridine(34) oxidoreductase MnmC [Thiothrix subterranea]